MLGFIYAVLGLQGYLLLLFTTYKVSVDMKVYSFVKSLKQVYDRERQDKMYSPLAFVLGYRLSHLLTEGIFPGKIFDEDITVPFLFSVITYFMSGYRSSTTHFFIFFAVNLLNHLVNVTFAMWCVSICRNFAEASLIANASLSFISLSCGYFIQARSLPVYVRWIKYISYVYWGFAALSSNGITQR
jgi:ABC-2 type transporter